MSNGSHPKSDTFNGAVDLTGKRLGDLQVLRRLGRGGMADVYVANQLTLGRQVALKVLRADLARDLNYVERFRREARAAARLTHPNIVQIYEVGCIDSLHFISQEYVDGVNLRQQLDRSGPLSPDQALVVMLGVSEALSVADESGITHRDIKPENIMVSKRGEVKVADFGLAAITREEVKNDLTQVGMTMGTPLYMSPEQVQGAAVDVRSDLYSLGVTMYHLLVGRPPFEADTPLALAVKHLHDKPTPIKEARPIQDVPAWMCSAIDRLMSKSAADRFQSPEELRNYLQKNLASSGPIGDGTATLTTRIDATKTLQSLMNRQASMSRFMPLVLTVLAWMIPILALGAGMWYGRQKPRVQLSQFLIPGELAVPTLDSVEAQYLEAVRLNEPEAWKKLIETFPANKSQTNAAYVANARIQLARLYRKREQFSEASQALDALLRDPDLAVIYRAAGLMELHETQIAAGKTAEAEKTRIELRNAYNTLQTNPSNQRLFDMLYPTYDPGTTRQS